MSTSQKVSGGGNAFGGQCIFYFEEDTMFSYVLSCRHKLNL